jgi:hypothetical protein
VTPDCLDTEKVTRSFPGSFENETFSRYPESTAGVGFCGAVGGAPHAGGRAVAIITTIKTSHVDRLACFILPLLFSLV